MKIVLLENFGPTAREAARRLRAAGHDVLHTDSTQQAVSCARLERVDMVIAALFPRGLGSDEESGLNLALAAQFHNPDVVTILLSDSAVFTGGELFDMLFSLRCVLPRPLPLADLMEIALHFLDVGPVDCASEQLDGTEVCGRCLLSGICAHAQAQRLCA